VERWKALLILFLGEEEAWRGIQQRVRERTYIWKHPCAFLRGGIIIRRKLLSAVDIMKPVDTSAIAKTYI